MTTLFLNCLLHVFEMDCLSFTVAQLLQLVFWYFRVTSVAVQLEFHQVAMTVSELDSEQDM
jgi:hypothetical protein